jgi:glutamine amidotransferase
VQNIAVIDYGMSNLRSVVKALEYVAGNTARIDILDDPERILSADRIVFPGQGAMGQCMENIRSRGLDQVLLECLHSKPFLGICLGLQTLMQTSEEDGGTPGLGVLAGKVLRFPAGHRDSNGNLFKIPQMGWNQVQQRQPHHLWQGIDSGERFYFVHSYYIKPDDESVIAGTTDYILEYTSAAARDNLFATQFHPEKSQRCGLRLLQNFLTWL